MNYAELIKYAERHMHEAVKDDGFGTDPGREVHALVALAAATLAVAAHTGTNHCPNCCHE